MSSLEEEYVCTLDDCSLLKAINELNEDPDRRLVAIQALRQWLAQQSNIRCPTDARFLLTFLRARYFGELDTRILLQNFLMRRKKFSKWFQNLDPSNPQMQAVIDEGGFLSLPERDSDGRKMLIIRPGNLDFSGSRGYTKQDIFRTYACIMDYLYLLDEMTSVNGAVAIVDLGNFTIKQYMTMTKEEKTDFLQIWQSGYPARIKKIHVYNIGTLADVILNLIKLCMSEKIQHRVKTHGQTLESLYREVPMHLLPKEYLPPTYQGSHAGTESEIIDKLKMEITKPEIIDRLRFISSDQFGMNELQETPQENVFLTAFKKFNLD